MAVEINSFAYFDTDSGLGSIKAKVFFLCFEITECLETKQPIVE